MELRNGEALGPEPEEIGSGGSFVSGCLIALVISLVVGGAVGLRARSGENGRMERTRAALAALEARVHAKEKTGMAPRSDGSGADWTGLEALKTFVAVTEPDDGWGNPLRYRCPGPVHKRGWDIYSCGPNGKDDHGTFDDICVGADVSAVSSHP